MEPSSPPGGDFWSRSDITIQPAGDDSFDPESDASSTLEAGRDHTVSVRVFNVGPAQARGVTVSVRAAPYVGMEFRYPGDWRDPSHLRAAPVDDTPFTLDRRATRIVRFTFTAEEVSEIAGWAEMGFHPCLLAVTEAENDYAFADAPGGLSLQMRRNNLAQRNLSVVSMRERRSAAFPFVIGHPANVDPRLELIVEAGSLVHEGEVFLMLSDASRAFPAALRAQTLARGTVKIRKVSGAIAQKLDGQPALRLRSPRAIVEIVRPRPARYALHLVTRFPDAPGRRSRYEVRVMQRVDARGITGGATVVFVDR
jgi:hypothetical protein